MRELNEAEVSEVSGGCRSRPRGGSTYVPLPPWNARPPAPRPPIVNP